MILKDVYFLRGLVEFFCEKNVRRYIPYLLSNYAKPNYFYLQIGVITAPSYIYLVFSALFFSFFSIPIMRVGDIVDFPTNICGQ